MIKSLTIKNWKAFEEKHITFDEGITFFVGRNGSGKTTVLEGICLSVTGRSLTADFQELVREPRLAAEVKLDIDDLPPKYRSRSYVRIGRNGPAPIFGPFSMLVLKFASHF